MSNIIQNISWYLHFLLLCVILKKKEFRRYNYGWKKNIEVVSGDGSNLDISPVYEHLNESTPKSSDEKPKNIVIPQEKPKKEEKKDNEKNEDEEKKEN